jgi:hypothetical protein
MQEKSEAGGDFVSGRGLSGACDEDIDGSGMGGPPVFEDEDALPGAQSHLPSDDRDDLACACECHSQVAGGIVGTFEGMNVIAGLRGDFFEVLVEVGPSAWISIFVDDEAGAGMADKQRHCAGLDSAVTHNASDLVGDLVGAFAVGADGDLSVFRDHCGLMTTSSQPARNNKPPIGVIAPSQRTLVIAKR